MKNRVSGVAFLAWLPPQVRSGFSNWQFSQCGCVQARVAEALLLLGHLELALQYTDAANCVSVSVAGRLATDVVRGRVLIAQGDDEHAAQVLEGVAN